MLHTRMSDEISLHPMLHKISHSSESALCCCKGVLNFPRNPYTSAQISSDQPLLVGESISGKVRDIPRFPTNQLQAFQCEIIVLVSGRISECKDYTSFNLFQKHILLFVLGTHNTIYSRHTLYIEFLMNETFHQCQIKIIISTLRTNDDDFSYHHSRGSNLVIEFKTVIFSSLAFVSLYTH